MRYSNVDFNIVYVDPSRSSDGDGTTPATAKKGLPTTAAAFAENTCYLIRRTAESSACVIPNGTNSSVTNLLLMGMPTASDPMWELVPAEARTAWGSDSAQYANVKTSTSGCSFQAPYAQQFVLHRTYLFRDGVTADNYLLKFNNTSDFTGCFSFDHCKFGAKGVNLDSSSYKSEVTTNCICGYVYIYNARMVSVTDCVMAHGLCAYSSYPHGIYVRFAEVMNVDNVRVFSPAWTNSNQAYPLCLSEYALDGVECNVRNVTQTVRLNGTSGQYVPSLMAAQGYVSMNVENIVVKTGEPLSANRPTNYQVYNPLLNFQSVVEMSMRNVDLEYRDCWNARTTVLNLSRCYVSNYVPGIVKELKDIKVAMAREDGIGSPISYSYASQSGSGYAAVVMDFSSSDAQVYAKVPCVDNLTVKCYRGKAFYGNNIRLTEAEFEGGVWLQYSVADIKSVKTFNGAYVERFVFTQESLFPNAFNVFVKTPEYDKRMQNISSHLQKIKMLFESNVCIKDLLRCFAGFAEGFVVAKDGTAACAVVAGEFAKPNSARAVDVPIAGRLVSKRFPKAGPGTEVVFRIRATTPETKQIEFSLMQNNGRAWGTNVEIGTEWREVRLPFEKLRFFSQWGLAPLKPGEKMDARKMVTARFMYGNWISSGTADKPHGFEISSFRIIGR